RQKSLRALLARAQESPTRKVPHRPQVESPCFADSAHRQTESSHQAGIRAARLPRRQSGCTVSSAKTPHGGSRCAWRWRWSAALVRRGRDLVEVRDGLRQVILLISCADERAPCHPPS